MEPDALAWASEVDPDHRAALLDRALDASAVALGLVGPDGRLVAANRALAGFLGAQAPADLIGSRLQEHMLREDRRTAPGVSDRAFVLPDGAVRWGRLHQAGIGTEGPTLIQIFDVTEARESRAQLEYDAGHDHLTGLVNRRTFMEALDASLAGDEVTALLVVDVDRFKSINDALGHPEGDRLLEVLASRLRSTMRNDDVVCRLGGDEFAVLLRAPVSVSDATKTGERVVALASEPVELDGQPVATSVSVGVSFSTPGSTLESLLSEADMALYRAKTEGRNRCVVFDDELRSAVERRSRLEGELRVALSNERLSLHYQPEVELRSGRMVGMEALIRWEHPVHGLLSADRFVSLAEDAGIVAELGRWVLTTACQTLADLADLAGGDDLMMRVNVSAVQLARAEIVDEVAAVIADTGIDPGCLCLEITETAVMTDVERAQAVLAGLAELGVRVAIDDFGTGFSSLAYLKRLPVRELKIDKSFVDDVTTDADGEAIVVSVLLLAASLDLGVIAEGVEREEQRQALISLGCERAQGHLFAPALSATDLQAWMRDRAGT